MSLKSHASSVDQLVDLMNHGVIGDSFHASLFKMDVWYLCSNLWGRRVNMCVHVRIVLRI